MDDEKRIPLKTLIDCSREEKVARKAYLDRIYKGVEYMPLCDLIDRQHDKICEEMEEVFINCDLELSFYWEGQYRDLVYLISRNHLSGVHRDKSEGAVFALGRLFLKIGKKEWNWIGDLR